MLDNDLFVVITCRPETTSAEVGIRTKDLSADFRCGLVFPLYIHTLDSGLDHTLNCMRSPSVKWSNTLGSNGFQHPPPLPLYLTSHACAFDFCVQQETQVSTAYWKQWRHQCVLLLSAQRQEPVMEANTPCLRSHQPRWFCYSICALLPHTPLSAVHNGPSPERKQAFTYTKPWGNPYQSSGLTFSGTRYRKAMQICPACVYLSSVSVCSTGTSIVSCVAIIACNLHRIRTENSALISHKAGRSLCRPSRYLTAWQNYRFSCGVLNLQGVFIFSCAGTLSPPNVACLSAMFVL